MFCLFHRFLRHCSNSSLYVSNKCAAQPLQRTPLCHSKKIHTMNAHIIAFTFSLLVVLSPALQASDYQGGTPTTIFETLLREDALDITIETDLGELINNRRREDYQPATMTYKSQNGVSVRHNIEVMPRGKFRRRICDFPPVKIKFSKKELTAAGLKKHNNLKLSTHCMDDKEAGNYNVFKEYLAYKLYNALTPNSFRVQLVRVTYVDAAGQLSKVKRYGFLIEDDEELAERMGGSLCECLNAGSDMVAAYDETMMSVYNYMIGNEDWSLSMVRNIKMVETAGGSKVLPIAYDFDFSGLVNASYALPSSDYEQRHIKDRDYLGFEADAATMQNVLQRLREKKSELYRIISDFKLLPAEQRLEMRDYLESFYQIIQTLPADSRQLPSWRFGAAAPVNAGTQGASETTGR